MLGHISRKYESGNFGPGAVSNIPGDPGGKSYGVYQFSLNKGILGKFVEHTTFIQLKTCELGSVKFDEVWRSCVKQDKFVEEQEEFAIDLYFKPIRALADKYNIQDVEPINEALFSIAIQHGRYSKIVINAVQQSCVHNIAQFVETLYKVRTE